MTDIEIRDALIDRDPQITEQFFYQDCRPLICSVAKRIFGPSVDTDEVISELYLFIMDSDGKKLKMFRGDSSIFQWLKVVTIRFCMQLKRQRQVIENRSSEPLYHEHPCMETSMDTSDLHRLLDDMPNRRYASVITRLMINGEDHDTVATDMGVTPDNLYNIKRRAMTALTRQALKDIQHYE